MIKWTKETTQLLGRVGDVLCFYVTKVPQGFELVCDLPEAVPNMYGRYVTTHPTPKAAATHAEQVLKHWKRRFES